jgi:hypothetical protein
MPIYHGKGLVTAQGSGHFLIRFSGVPAYPRGNTIVFLKTGTVGGKKKGKKEESNNL